MPTVTWNWKTFFSQKTTIFASATSALHCSVEILQKTATETASLKEKIVELHVSYFYYERYWKAAEITSFLLVAYAAPEIIKRGSYDPKKGDIWSLGVVVFTLLYGEMPFVFNKQIYENQMKRSYTLRQKKLKINLQPDCIEFLSELLEPNAAKRPDIHAVCALEWLDKDIIVVG